MMDVRAISGRSMSVRIHRATVLITAIAISEYASAFLPVANHAIATIPTQHKKTRCNAKLDKIASSFDLDEILSNEKEFNAGGDETASTSSKGKKGRKRNQSKATNKKAVMKEEMKKQKLEKQQLKKSLKDKQNTGAVNDNSWHGDGSDELDEDSGIDYENLMKSIDFVAYEVPSALNGKRIDAVLVDLLNEDDSNSAVSISRSQCGTLLSNDCVFIVPPEAVTDFRASRMESNTGNEASSVTYNLIEKFSSPIQRKSQQLESSSILIYPSRSSLLSTSSSSTLLSNFIPPTEIIAQNIPLDILYEDEQMIVLNKKAGMVVHPAAGNWDGTVVNALAYYLMNESPFGAGEFFTDESKEVSDDPDVNQNDAVTNSISTLRPGIVHRLDKGTTGVLVVAKTSSALATLSEAFAERKVKKQYLAVAIGNPGDDQWINKPIGRHPLHRQRMRVVPDPSASMSSRGQPRLTGAKSASMAKQGRQALSHIHTIHYDGKLSVVQVRIATGRTHQIRVHLQDHGTPIYGDDVYGLSDWNKALSSRRGITRPLLHAHRLEIDHPITGESMTFEAQVADDMMGVIKAIWPAGEKIEF